MRQSWTNWTGSATYANVRVGLGWVVQLALLPYNGNHFLVVLLIMVPSCTVLIKKQQQQTRRSVEHRTRALMALG